MRLCVLFSALSCAAALRVPFTRRSSVPDKTSGQFDSIATATLPDDAVADLEKQPKAAPLRITEQFVALEDSLIKGLPSVDFMSQLSSAALKLGEQLDALDEAIQKNLGRADEAGVSVSTVDAVATAVTEKEEEVSDAQVGKIVGIVEDMVDQLYFGVPGPVAEATDEEEKEKETAPVPVATSSLVPKIVVMDKEVAQASADKVAMESRKTGAKPATFEKLYKEMQTVGVEAVKAAKATQEETAAEAAATAEAVEAEVAKPIATEAVEAAPVLAEPVLATSVVVDDPVAAEPVVAEPEPVATEAVSGTAPAAALTTAELVKVPFRGAYEMLREGRTTRRKFWSSRVRRGFAKVFRRKWLRS
uniref:Uncharacterized protein n=1 Tax=Pinguiococcus pyrenoidosus TaxID=172671 RepID=A0A7R9YCZ8_9STRA|mmetsp:Transcript_1970/g.8702  ORF Transcript_1970/g.8702 Transcript_1970/m.8702 type:complete len:361 (+) Transcript_1970:186-1268(+)